MEHGLHVASSARPKTMRPQAIEPVVLPMDSRGGLLHLEVERHVRTTHYSRPDPTFCIHTKVLLPRQPKWAFAAAKEAIVCEPRVCNYQRLHL
jgi:hypothetical protein